MGSSWRSFFCFQAEDGIRDRSPSRGLGDVYKRQAICSSINPCTDRSVLYLYGLYSQTAQPVRHSVQSGLLSAVCQALTVRQATCWQSLPSRRKDRRLYERSYCPLHLQTCRCILSSSV